jgi:hypothetical protein
LLAEAGEPELAVRALEIGLARFEPGQVSFESEDLYSARYKLKAHGLTLPARELFPITLGEEALDLQWLTRARDALLEWDRAERLDPHAARVLLTAVAVRLHERRRGEEALAVLDRLEEHARETPGQRHLLIDLSRLLGREARARELEDELLARSSLDPERVAEVVARIEQTSGAESALAAGEKAAETTPTPELVEKLIALASELGRPEAAERFGKLRAECEAAAAELDAKW